ncbi:hypothetical protein [Streptomyces sp. NPDC018045]|uniref:hypothetical protein n=1 Tax=Streptomyces sp. NPDC018045 TaxID=3365037 RepID=UPI0037BAFE0F
MNAWAAERVGHLLPQAKFAAQQKELSSAYHARGLHMEGRPYRMSGRPLIIEREEFAALERGMRDVYALLEHVVDLYAEHEELRTLFSEYREHESAVLAYPPTPQRIEVCRLDCAWYGGDSFKVMEANTACPGGVVQIPMATRQWLETDWARRLLGDQTLVDYPMLRDPYTFARALVSSARTAGFTVDAAAVVNMRGVYTYEVEWIVRSFQELGVEAQLCDARSMRDGGGAVRCAGRAYQVLYNKLDPLMLLGDPAAAEYLAMFREHQALLVNPLVAQTITEDKAVLAVLSDPRYASLFDAAQRAVIAKHVPWTRLVRQGRTTGPDGTDIDLFAHATARREHLVLKPANLTRGEGVLIGPHVDERQWQEGLGAAAKGERYVLQEYTPLPRMDIPTADGSGTQRVNVDLSCYLLAGSLAGFFSRCSDNPVVNLGTGGACVPVVQVDGKPAGAGR